MEWIIGKQEYDRNEVESLLETQRAMVLNDLRYVLIDIAEEKGLKGKFTEEGLKVLESFKTIRKPEY